MMVPLPLLEEIREHLRAAYPAEGCGLLLGLHGAQGVKVHAQMPTPNRRWDDASASNRYLVSPDDYLRAERTARRQGLEVVGVYHSHPDAPAQPSSVDRDHAWPWYRYLILSIRNRVVAEERVWELAEDRSVFEEQVLKVEEG